MTTLIWTTGIYCLAAVAEIAGCFAFWIWLRANGSILWLIPGLACLVLFAALLTRADVSFAGRAYAAYGGIYIGASLLWLWGVEGQAPTRWDLTGAAFCVLGMAIIVAGSTAQSQ
ncbi:YnfA family protein [Parasedimentitalea psychrophila]|uniref:YnfA family protein n=1 Tax=Parasedimentitalea psychrophila TaxID=2997337 RepID=A0A9Y2L2I6_9RHOB|nr:YnfA family protein [Parasedimentitalea psychrophila]WIY26182.1 YnfA family protein [Parasedimentitalea psychrophila]